MAFPIAAAATGLLGLIQTGVSASRASKLPNDKSYEPSEELQLAYNMSRRRADEGYSPEEKAAFEQMLARQGNATKRMLNNVGLSGVGSAAENIMGIDALNQFAAEGANIRRQNFDKFASLAGQMQDVQDMETTRSNQQLNAQREALGQATQSGISNILGGIGGAQNFAQTGQAIDIYKNMGMGGQGNNGLLSMLSNYQNQIPQYGTSPLEGYPGFGAATYP